MIDFLDGVAFAGCIGVSFWFIRSWLTTRDRLLLGFAAGFATFALSRLLLAATSGADEGEPAIYLLRAAGFAMIIAAVVDRIRGD